MLLLVLLSVVVFPVVALELAAFISTLELASAPVVAESRSFSEIMGV